MHFLLVAVLFSFSFFSSITAKINDDPTTPLQLDLTWEDPSLGSNGPMKQPILAPTVYQIGHELLFGETHSDYILQILDDDQVLFETTVLSAESTTILPSALSGTYELRLFVGIYCFVGEITL